MIERNFLEVWEQNLFYFWRYFLLDVEKQLFYTEVSNFNWLFLIYK